MDLDRNHRVLSARCYQIAIIGEAAKRLSDIVLQIVTEGPLHCHLKDLGNTISANQVVRAGELHVVLSSIPRNNVV